MNCFYLQLEAFFSPHEKGYKNKAGFSGFVVLGLIRY